MQLPFADADNVSHTYCPTCLNQTRLEMMRETVSMRTASEGGRRALRELAFPH